MTDTRKLVDYAVEDSVAFLTLAEPPTNAFSYQMMRDLDEAILKARFDDDVHVLVLTGSGEEFFSAGADLNMLASVTPRFKYFFYLHANETLRRLEQTPKLVVAALNGHALAGGLEIALAADLRLAWQRPSGPVAQVGFPEVDLGVLPGTGGTQRLPRLIGKSPALEMIISGRRLDMCEAADLGLVDRLLPAESLAGFRQAVLAETQTLVPPDRAGRALGLVKRAIQTGLEIPLDAGLALERELQQQLLLGEDAREGISAHRQKRKPRFRGA